MATRRTTSKKVSSASSKTKTSAVNKNVRDTVWAISLFAVALCIVVFFVAAESAPLCAWTTSFLFGLFGGAAIAVPIVIVYIGVIIILGQEKRSIKIWLSCAFVLLLAVFINICTMPHGAEEGAEFSKIISDLYFNGAKLASGGILGGAIALPLTSLATAVGAGIIVFTVMIVIVVLATGFTFSDFIGTPEQRREKREQRIKEKEERISEKEVKASVRPVKFTDISEEDTDEFKRQIDEIADKYDTDLSFTTNLTSSEKEEIITKEDIAEAKAEIAGEISENSEKQIREYVFPSLDLLKEPKHTNTVAAKEELVRMGEKLTDALMSFGVETRITHVSRGPTVTRYELEPGRGVKISKITNLSDDIALNLAAKGVRIEAPIPGKEAIGIEVPNQTQQTVYLREVLDSREFKESESKITAALGKDISGENIVIDIAKMPHLLIAGTTGTGKSVCINSILISFLYKAGPEDVKLILVDPKMVEFTVYKGLPHLLIPVVTDAKKAAGALSWAVSEMLSRYQLFAEKGVRDFNGYNRNLDPGEKKLPQIVIVIDELSDLMMASPKEVEDAVCRLAQMARAAGMHLVVATQRPSAEVVTGIIKANIPSRIALAVSSGINSRIILDEVGAEKLVGKGDMLYDPLGAVKPLRVQGCFVSDKEVERVVEAVKENADVNEYDEEIMEKIEKAVREQQQKGTRGVVSGEDGNSDGHEDEMLDKAIEVVVEMGQASTTMLQRRVGLGYARAARLIDVMEQRGIVGPYQGSKPRAVLLTKEQWLEMKMRKSE